MDVLVLQKTTFEREIGTISSHQSRKSHKFSQGVLSRQLIPVSDRYDVLRMLIAVCEIKYVATHVHASVRITKTWSQLV
jgi:hypothetical protein